MGVKEKAHLQDVPQVGHRLQDCHPVICKVQNHEVRLAAVLGLKSKNNSQILRPGNVTCRSQMHHARQKCFLQACTPAEPS